MSSSYRSSAGEIAVNVPSLAATIGWLVVAAIAQTTFLHPLAIRGAVPSPIVVVVVLYALRVELRRGLMVGALGGLLEDALGGGTGGAWTLATTLVALAASLASSFVFSDSPPALVAAIAVGALLRSGFFWIFMGLGGYPNGMAVAHLHTAIISALYTALIGTIAVLIIDRRRERPVHRYPLRDFR